MHTKKTAACAVLTALALIFSYIEFLIPVSVAIPGIKLGLANIVVLIAIYAIGPGYALFISLVRVLLAALLFGNVFSALYSLGGALVSLVIMLLLKKTGIFSIAGVSMGGGVAHNLGQLAVAALVIQNGNIIYYMPVLLIAGLLTGAGIGVIASLVLRKLPAMFVVK